MILGEEFDGYVYNICVELDWFDIGSDFFVEVNLGGIVIGIWINILDGYVEFVVEKLVEVIGYLICFFINFMELFYDNGVYIVVYFIIKCLVVKIFKICNDL